MKDILTTGLKSRSYLATVEYFVTHEKFDKKFVRTANQTRNFNGMEAGLDNE